MKKLKSYQGFLGLPKEISSKNKVSIIPFGLEKSVSYGNGTKYGPEKIIEASHQVELFDEELFPLVWNGVWSSPLAAPPVMQSQHRLLTIIITTFYNIRTITLFEVEGK